MHSAEVWVSQLVDRLMAKVVRRDPHEPEFHQAVREWAESVAPIVADRPTWESAKLLERMVEPERVVSFRVSWVDDGGNVQVNRGYRVQFSSVLGPYKGGLRFHPSVNLSILKFLGFEQTFKNSLTTLPLGGGKGGADFDPKGRSDGEVMRFCQAMMTELFRHIGADTDVPAGDIGVGAREIGYLYGQYRRLANRVDGTFTGKAPGWGGSLVRPEATGYGVTYFALEMLCASNDDLRGKRVTVSGSGNVAQYAVEKLIASGATVLTMSDSGGCLIDEGGFDAYKLAAVMALKNERRGRLAELPAAFPSMTFVPNGVPWVVPCDLAFPCATQNEIDLSAAKTLVANGCRGVIEGANMASTLEGVHFLRAARIPLAPGKAANAGGVATSGLEMSQNAMRLSWTRAEVEEKLATIMRDIHRAAVAHGTDPDGFVDYVRGANVAGFLKVADAMLDQGLL